MSTYASTLSLENFNFIYLYNLPADLFYFILIMFSLHACMHAPCAFPVPIEARGVFSDPP